MSVTVYMIFQFASLCRWLLSAGISYSVPSPCLSMSVCSTWALTICCLMYCLGLFSWCLWRPCVCIDSCVYYFSCPVCIPCVPGLCVYCGLVPCVRIFCTNLADHRLCGALSTCVYARRPLLCISVTGWFILGT